MSDHPNRKNLLPSRKSACGHVSAGLLLAFASAFPMTDPAFAENYTLTNRVKPTEAGINGLPAGKKLADLTAGDTLNVTGGNAQLYFDSSADMNCNIIISGNARGSEKTGKFRLQNSSTVVNLNGMVTLAGDTAVGSHVWQSSQGKLYFNNQITGTGALLIAPSSASSVYLNNTGANKNNYTGNTQIGNSGMYNNSGVTNYGGSVYLLADEQIPDTVTAGASAVGNLVLMSWEDTRLRSKLDLNGHTETVNGLVSADTWSVVTSSADGGKLIAGANNATSEFKGMLQGSMALEKIGSGTLTFSGTNTYTGTTTVTAGTLKLADLSAAGSGAVSIASGAVFEITAPAEENTWNGGNISGSGSLKVSGDGPFTIPLANFQMDGNAGKLVVDGANLTLNNLTNSTANYSGSDILIDNAGSLKFAHTGSADQIWLSNQTNITFGASGGGTFNTGNSSESDLNFVNNSTTKFITTGGAANYISGTNGFNLHGQNITFDVAKGTAADGNDLIVSARLWNNHGIVKDGAGTMVLTATNSNFRGNVTINAGKVIASTNSSLGAVQNGKSVFVNEGAELSIGAQDVFANAHENNAVQFIVDGGKISNAGAVYNYLQNTTFKDGAELHAVDGNAVWKAFKLHNVNVLRNDDGSAAAPVRFTSAPNSPNAVIGFGDITGNIASGISTLNIQDITSANASVSDDLPDLIISGIVADPTINTNTKETRPTAVKKTGNGMLELTAANTFTGQVTVSEGVLRLSDSALAVKAPIALEANGTLDLNAAEGTEKAFSGRVTGTGRTVKSGTGTLTLNTANGFEASSLNVSAGRANIVGTLSGDLAIADGASFSPGDGIGTLAVNGDFTVGDGAQLVFEFGEDASDLLVIGSEGTLDISEDAVLELLFNDADPNNVYTLIEAEGGLGEYADAEFWTDLLTTAADTNWQLQVAGNTLQAVFGASDSVPEPAAWALLVLGAAGLFIVRKKRV